MVVIAHRLATIEHADQILVVKDGAVVQRGTHEASRAEGVPALLLLLFVGGHVPRRGWKIRIVARPSGSSGIATRPFDICIKWFIFLCYQHEISAYVGH